jgi:hypothetical protein
MQSLTIHTSDRIRLIYCIGNGFDNQKQDFNKRDNRDDQINNVSFIAEVLNKAKGSDAHDDLKDVNCLFIDKE